MQILLVLFHILTCIALIALVLLQQGKGAEMGAAFGAGASGTVFGSPGASSFLFKVTMVLGAAFFLTSLGLGYYDDTMAKKSQNILLPTAIVQKQQQNAPTENKSAPALTVDTPATTPTQASMPVGAVDTPASATPSSGQKSK